MDDAASRVDFFISYNGADREWAEWIAWVLEEAGFTILLQAWDFRPGGNFVLEMHRAAIRAERIIAVLSPDYLGASFPQPEWAAGFVRDPEGLNQQLVPVMVRPCEPAGMLKAIVQIRLYGLRREEARANLLAGVVPGRAKPVSEPAFPGEATVSYPLTPVTTSNRLRWKPLEKPVVVQWRTELLGSRGFGHPLLELHAVPADPVRLEARELATLATRLVGLGRARGIFTRTQQVHEYSNDSAAIATSPGGRDLAEAGLAATRTGQASIWAELPRNQVAAILDPDDVRSRLQSLLESILAIGIVDRAPQYAMAIGMEPSDLLTVGRVAELQRENSAHLPFTGSGALRIEPEDSLTPPDLQATAAVAEELAARISGRFIPHS
jgi:hypothetical protein